MPDFARRVPFLILVAVVLTVVSFPPIGWWPLAWVAWVPLVLALEGRPARAAFAITWLYSAGMAILIVRWLVHALSEEYGVAGGAAWIFTLLLVGGYAVLPALAAAGFATVRGRLHPAAGGVTFAALWMLSEWVRSEPGGLPWLLAGHTLARAPLALQTADLGGVYLVGFVLVSANAGLALAVAQRSVRPLFVPLLLVAASLAYGGWRIVGDLPSSQILRVGVIQASVPQAERFQPGSAPRNLAHHANLTRRLTRVERLDLVVWSETAVDRDIDQQPRLRVVLEELARETGVPLLTGAPRSVDGNRRNSVVLVTPSEGVSESYDKQRLVPFSEYDPKLLGFLAPLLGPVTEGDPYVPGRTARVLSSAPAPLATPICFEMTYPSLIRRFRAASPGLLVNLSNDAWFGRTGYAAMHFEHSILRAVELRSWVVRGANTGISAIVDPWGRVVSALGLFEEGTLIAEVGARSWNTLYARFGDMPVLAFLFGVVLASAAQGRSGARSGGGTGPSPRS